MSVFFRDYLVVYSLTLSDSKILLIIVFQGQ